MWTISIRETHTQAQLAYWVSDSLPDVLAIKASYAPRLVTVVQYRFLDRR